MTDPLDTNDEWANLEREFNLDKPPPLPDRVERIIEEEAVEPHHGTDARLEADALAEGETEAEAAEDDFDDAEDAPTGEAAAEGEQPGTGRKRRRRRRRRRKGGAPTEGAAAPAEGTEAESAPPAEADEEPAEPLAEADSFDADAEDVDGEAVPLAADEDTASEVLRELIATWNVPSWDEIVGGLYRPN